MSRHIEYVSPANLRLDGRRPPEYRRLKVEYGTFPSADGSCTYTTGSTQIAAVVYGPREAGFRSEGNQANASLSVEVAINAFSTQRRLHSQRHSKQAQELSAAVKAVAQATLRLQQYPNSHIQVYVEVLQQGGSEKVACINAAMLALCDASLAMTDNVVALTVGQIDRHLLVDLTAEEGQSQCPHAALAVRAHDPNVIVWMEMDSRVSDEVLDSLVGTAIKAAGEVYNMGGIDAGLRETAAARCQPKLNI